ncbi:hypothetical protein [Streptomyces sp. CS149]|uniref:hypothetical protein n=1 Tax=Streptomyces sp. CS149 TaxID=2109332 RepID=UPI001F374356|nr:hypothetical protein [Streptomyces sp. CS149]
MSTAAVERASLVVRRAPRGVLVRGDRVRCRGSVYAVAGLDGVRVHLAPEGGDQAPVSLPLAVLASAADFAVLDGAGHPLAQAELPDFAALEGIPAASAEAAQAWWRAVVEVDTGLPPDAPAGARPRSLYDPATTTFIERYQAKAAELHAVLGWSVSWQHTGFTSVSIGGALQFPAVAAQARGRASPRADRTPQGPADQVIHTVACNEPIAGCVEARIDDAPHHALDPRGRDRGVDFALLLSSLDLREEDLVDRARD